MKIGTFFIFFIIMLVLGMLESFFLNDGHLFTRDKDGYLRLRMRGGIGAGDWAKILILSIAVGLFASLASAAAWLGLLCYIAMLVIMAFITIWCCNEASQIREIIVFIIMLFVAYFVVTKSYIAASILIRNAAWLSVFRTVALVELVACITIILVSNLRYRASGAHLINPRKLTEKMRKYYPILAVIVGVIGLAICVGLFITGIQWRGF